MFEGTPKILFPVEMLSVQAVDDYRLHYELSLRFYHTILILIQATQASHWLIFCQPLLLRLLSYGNENDNCYGKHLRSWTELQ